MRTALSKPVLSNEKAMASRFWGKGDLDYPLSLRVNMVSRGARSKIEAAGGSIIEVV